MKVLTKHFGEIEINKEDILTFPRGITPFEDNKEFIFIPATVEEQTPFFFLQSTTDEELCFLTLKTFDFFPQYDIEIDDKTVKELNLKAEDVEVITIVNAKNGLKSGTTNLKAPIIINTKENLAKQVVLEKGNFSLRQPLIVSQPDDTEKVKG